MCRIYSHVQLNTRDKPEIVWQTLCCEEFVTSEQFPMRYCSTWLRPLLCYNIKRFVIEELVTKKSVPLYNVYVCTYAPRYVLFWDTNGETQCGIKEYPSTYVLPSYR